MPQVKTIEELRKSDPFADGANLDLSQYPYIREENRASVVRADKDDVHLVADGSHTNLLKNVEQMIERDGGDREIADVLKAGGIENPRALSVFNIEGQSITISYSGGCWVGEGIVGDKKRRLTSTDREQLLGKFAALARKSKRETIQELTEGQLTEVARMAQRDRVAAINIYLGHAFPQGYAENNDADQIVNDPRLANFLAHVCSFVWLNSRLDATDSEDWRDFAAQFCGDRPVSCALLDNAWAAFTDSRNRLIFTDLPRHTQEEAPAAAERLDDLSDDEINATYKGVARAFAQR